MQSGAKKMGCLLGFMRSLIYEVIHENKRRKNNKQNLKWKALIRSAAKTDYEKFDGKL